MNQTLPPPIQLYRLASGFYVSRALHVAAELGIADLLADGPRPADALAAATSTHAPSLRRVLRLLASAEVLREEADGRFALTAVGQFLRAGVRGSARAAVLLFGGITQQAWSELAYSVRTGKPAFDRVFGADSFSYMAQHPAEAANFDQAMAGFTSMIAGAVAASYDFPTGATVVDVGGGNGTFLAGVLAAKPGVRGVSFDLPHVAERARQRLAELGLADRCLAQGGDFFREVPKGDIYTLKHVIHDWDDERAAAILSTCRRAMPAAGRVLIVEGIYPPRIDSSDAARGAAANDVNMLVCTGGRQRSEPEFRALFAASDLKLDRIVPTPAPVAVLEAVAA
jgi:SAM-dependent methyltransferase